MSEIIGISGAYFHPDYLSILKRNLILFDRIAIPNLEEFFKFDREVKGIHPLLMLMQDYSDFLRYRETSKKLRSFNKEIVSAAEKGHLFEAFDTLVLKRIAEINKPDAVINNTELVREFELLENIDYDKDMFLMPDYFARCTSLIMNEQKSERQYETIPILNNISLPENTKSSRTSVAELLIKQIPIPDVSTRWESIFEFKTDPDNKGRMASLKRWITKIAQSSLSATEIEDEIEYLLYKYRKSLELHKIKYKTGTLHTIIMNAGLMRNLLTFNFSAASKEIFSLKEAKANLLTAELNTEGNELSYIYNTQRTF